MCVYDYDCICVPAPKIISNVQHLTLFTKLHSIMVMCGHTVIFLCRVFYYCMYYYTDFDAECFQCRPSITFLWRLWISFSLLMPKCGHPAVHTRLHICTGKVTALGVLCCLALFVCLTLLASFFLPSHLSFKTCIHSIFTHSPVEIYLPTCMYT